MTIRSRDGRETWRRLREWDRGQVAAERLAGHILRAEGYTAVDPSHPLGGPDGLKDVLCESGGNKWIGAAYFPRGQQTLKHIKDKVLADAAGASLNSANGIAFVTNQEITLAEREEFVNDVKAELDLFHLERVSSRLDSPDCYGVRLEFLDIEMTKEEQLAFIAARDLMLSDMHNTIKALVSRRSTGLDEKDVPSVTPRYLGGLGYIDMYGPKPHECSACKGVFLIESQFGRTTSLGFAGSMRTITCPYCGRTERYTAWW
jgi:hypothetical protein